MSKRVIVFGTASEQALVRTIEELRLENAALREDYRKLAATISDIERECSKEVSAAKIKLEITKRENAAMRQDKERLDWLESLRSLWEGNGETGPVFLTRASIDAARKEAQP